MKPKILCGQNKFYTQIGTSDQDTSSISFLLSQRFTYLNEGAQTYAYVSEDGSYVLKLFKARHQKPFKFSRFLHHLKRTKSDWADSEERWKMKFKSTCARYELAFTHLKEETGLIFLHFHQTPSPLFVTLVNRSPQQIDLSKLPFIIQKKAILAPDYFKQNPAKSNLAKQALKDFFANRLKKGFSDPRQSLSINYGFVDDQPIQIDVGKIEPFTGDANAEINKIHAHVEKWVSTL